MKCNVDILHLKWWSNDDLNNFKSFMKNTYPDVIVGNVCPDPKTVGSHTHFNSFYIQIMLEKLPSKFHFEYWADGKEGVLAFHLEPDNNDINERKRYREIGINLMHLLSEKGYRCENWWELPYGTFIRGGISDFDDFLQVFDSFFHDIYAPLLEIYELKKGAYPLAIDYPTKTIDYKSLTNENEEVSVKIMTLSEIMRLNLTLPVYQREYSWEDRNIKDLWQSVIKVSDNKSLHLGTIILHDYNQSFGIIDGQQRLITLSIMLLGLGYNEYLPLLNQSYDSTDAQEHVANCKYIVQQLVGKENNTKELAKRIANKVSFAVLTVNESNLDLAYTFFSNQNSKGVPLSDFDLLKAHHLRFIPNDMQSEHMAVKWNTLNSLPNVYGDKNALFRTLGTHIYRLRRWMRKNESHEGYGHYIQYEYEAAKTMEDIPPFGENFDFYEKIQGGTHFFVYAETFISRYLEFLKSPVPVVEILQNNLAWGTYEKYSDAIETVLFAYFLKFGHHYLAEALYCIFQLAALYRYNTARDAGNGTAFRQFISDVELVLMLDQASSPTFFLAEALSKQEKLPHDRELFPKHTADEFITSGMNLPDASGIRWGMYKSLQEVSHKLLPYVTESTIRNKIIEEYGK